jgi:predicted O-linked N-acetylglucosamine transferase (SPINDLY family)
MWCFAPPAAAPDAGALPASVNGFVTFGSLNNFSKVSLQALALWARLLAALPGSRLLIAGVAEGEPRRRAAAAFAAAGVAQSRLTFRSRASHGEFLAQHRELDIALDSFPYSGGATTCDALWMGVPTITLAGDAVFARSGLSILGAVGLQQWVAQDEEDYLARAIAHASDWAALAALRAGLRARVAASPLCDVGGFAAAMEGQFRWMWRQWCKQTT